MRMKSCIRSRVDGGMVLVSNIKGSLQISERERELEVDVVVSCWSQRWQNNLELLVPVSD